MIKKRVKKEKNDYSILGILGAAFFGFLLGSLIRFVVNFTTPNVLMKIYHISFEEAKLLVSSSYVSNIIIGALIVFFSSGVAAFLAKKKGVLVGLLTNFLPILFWILAFAYALSSGADPIQLFFSSPFLQFIVIILASVFGGLYGQGFYKKERDLDIDKHGPTIFGVFWAHYIWITPLVLYPFISAVVAIIYSWLYTFSTDLYFFTNFRLWINIAWWFYFFINPLMILISGVALSIAFLKFWEVIQYKQTYYEPWEKGGKILVYGIAVPIVVKLIATFTIHSTENMFEPVINDWKVGVAYILIIPIAGIIIRSIWWIKDQITGKNKKGRKK